MQRSTASWSRGLRRRGAEAAAHGRWRGGLPTASAHPSDRLGFLWWGKRTANLRERAPGPHLFLLCVLRDGGQPAFHGLGAPDQGASQRSSWPLGQLAEINLTTDSLCSDNPPRVFSSSPRHSSTILRISFSTYFLVSGFISCNDDPKSVEHGNLQMIVYVPMKPGHLRLHSAALTSRRKRRTKR